MQWQKRIALCLAVLMLLTGITTACGQKKPTVSGGEDLSSDVSQGTESELSMPGNVSDLPGSEVEGSGSSGTSGKTGTTTGQNGKTTSKITGSAAKTTEKPPTATTKYDDAFGDKKKVFTEQVTDLKGITIKIASPWNEWVQTSGCPPYQTAAAKALQEIGKDYNCKVQMVNVDAGKMNQEIAVSYAGGKVYADIIETQGDPGVLAPYMEDLSKVSTLGLSTNDWEPYISQYGTYKGTQYGIGFMMTQNLAISQLVIVFNKKLADQYGVGDLYQTVRDGKWDYAAFEAASKTIYQKTNGKTTGLLQQISTTMQEMIFTNDVTVIGQDKSGYYFKYNDANLLSALNFWSNYCKNGYMYEHDSTDYGASAAKLFMQRKALFMVTDYIGTSTWFNSSMEDAYGVLPLPKGPAAKNYTTVAGCKYFMLTKDNPQIDAAGRVLVAMANRTGWDMNEWDTVQLETALRDEESLEMMKIINSSAYLAPNATRGLNESLFTETVHSIIHEQKSAAQLLQEIQGNQNASIVEYYK